MSVGRLFGIAMCAGISSLVACVTPTLQPNGAWQFEERRGAVIMGENGAEFRDVDDVPTRVVFHDVDEPYKTPIGFILPKSGVFSQTSKPYNAISQGIVVTVRPSDTRIPSWGGEILVRVDLHGVAPATPRPPENVAVVVDIDETVASPLLDATIARLGAKDRVLVVDAVGPRLLVPSIPATYRTLALAAAARRVEPSYPFTQHDLAKAFAMAGASGAKRIVCLCTASAFAAGPVAAARAELASHDVVARAFDPDDPEVEIALDAFVPASGAVVLNDVVVALDGAPAPSHLLEASGGDAIWTIEGGELHLGALRAGAGRYEVLRVSTPAFRAGARFLLRVNTTARDATTGKLRTFPLEIPFVFDDDLERIADSRHGDVIAYASALATMDRLHEAFIGAAKDKKGLLQLAWMQAKSLGALAKDFPDRGFAEDAAVFESLLQDEQ
jgi:hypothetical protein